MRRHLEEAEGEGEEEVVMGWCWWLGAARREVSESERRGIRDSSVARLPAGQRLIQSRRGKQLCST